MRRILSTIFTLVSISILSGCGGDDFSCPNTGLATVDGSTPESICPVNFGEGTDGNDDNKNNRGG
jgi:hypothetical protein